eukprot:9196447-Alexandrium_andersonii.AAC.1
MSASLVGSEMCIRDSCNTRGRTRQAGTASHHHTCIKEILDMRRKCPRSKGMRAEQHRPDA